METRSEELLWNSKGGKGVRVASLKGTREQRFDVRTCFEEEQEDLPRQKAQQRQRP